MTTPKKLTLDDYEKAGAAAHGQQWTEFPALTEAQKLEFLEKHMDAMAEQFPFLMETDVCLEKGAVQ